MNVKMERNWGLFVGGVALVLIGFILLAVPGITLVALSAIAGVMFLAAGIVDAYTYLRYRRIEGLSGWVLAFAICDVVLGVVLIVHPVISAVVIPWVIGIFAFAYGIFEIVAAVRMRKVVTGWGWCLFSGIVSALCGLAFFFVSATFALFLGLFVIARGVQMAVNGAVPSTTYVVSTSHR